MKNFSRRLLVCGLAAAVGFSLIGWADGVALASQSGVTEPGISDDALMIKAVDAFSGHKTFTRPNRDSQMGFSVPQRVLEVLGRSGMRVKKDDLIIRGDDVEAAAVLRLQEVRARSKATVDKARASMELTKLEFDKTVQASSGGGANPQELDRARLSFEAAKSDLEAASVQQEQEELGVDRLKASVERYRLRAPFDGIVDFVKVDPGQSTTENEKIVRVVNLSPIWVDVPAPTDETIRLGTKVGDKAWVLVEMGGVPKVLEARVIEVAPTGDASSRTRQVRLEVPNPDKADGSPGDVIAGEPAWVRLSAPTERFSKSFGASLAASSAANLATGGISK